MQQAVSDAVGASVGDFFAGHVAQKFAAVQEEVPTVRFEMAELDTRVTRTASAADSAAAAAGSAAGDATEALRTTAELRSSLDTLAAQVEQLRAAPPASADASCRRLARVGGLGWDETPSTLQDRTVELLIAAGIRRDVYGPSQPWWAAKE